MKVYKFEYLESFPYISLMHINFILYSIMQNLKILSYKFHVTYFILSSILFNISWYIPNNELSFWSLRWDRLLFWTFGHRQFNVRMFGDVFLITLYYFT